MMIIFVPTDVLCDSHMCAILFTLQRTSISNIFHLNNACGICTLLSAVRVSISYIYV